MTRDALMQAFVAEAGYSNRALEPLAGDASNRRYLRLPGTPPLVLMDAPPEKGEDVHPFIAMTQALRGYGLSAPAIIAQDPVHGFLLLEDLGDALFARAVAEVAEEQLYAAAVDLLAHLHRQTPPARVAPYDGAVYLREARLLTEWYLPAAGIEVVPEMQNRFDALIDTAIEDLAPDVLVLRDYHAENLLWLPARAGHARVGLLDYQDALIGHRAYDLVSLLEDARRDTEAELRDTMLARYIAATGEDAAAFQAQYATLGAQRNIKILGIFARLWLRDGKAAYLALMPRVWAHLQRDLAHPAVADLRGWIAQNVPAPEAAVLARMRTVR